MDQAKMFYQQHSGLINTVIFVGAALIILYVVYTYLYPSEDPNHVEFLNQEVDARKGPIHLKNNGKAPSIFTGGDFTLSFWMYIDDWNYQTSKYKPVFNLGPTMLDGTTRSILVGMLTPFKNGLLVRAATTNPDSSTPDITLGSARQALMNQQTSMAMFENTVDKPCDVKEVPLQRWVCVTIVNSGRVLDVYMNGKLARSCMLDSVVQIPRGDVFLSLGAFGGRYSSVQMWTQQLTPDVIYGIYMMGPTQTKHNIITDVSKFLGVNVTFTGSVPNQISSVAQDPFGAITNTLGYTAASMGYNPNTIASSLQAAGTGMYANAQNAMA